jgi:hypothetical protein
VDRPGQARDRFDCIASRNASGTAQSACQDETRVVLLPLIRGEEKDGRRRARITAIRRDAKRRNYP